MNGVLPWRCRSCKYYGGFNDNIDPCCIYYLHKGVGHRRPCPADENCYVYEKVERASYFTKKDEEPMIMAMYEAGYSDRQIGEAVGLSKWAILHWRQRNELPTKQGSAQKEGEQDKR